MIAATQGSLWVATGAEELFFKTFMVECMQLVVTTYQYVICVENMFCKSFMENDLGIDSTHEFPSFPTSCNSYIVALEASTARGKVQFYISMVGTRRRWRQRLDALGRGGL